MIEEKFVQLLATPSDINEHLSTIRKYVSKGDTVVELGVRDIVSSWALIANKPRTLISVDVVRPPEERLGEILSACEAEGIEYKFIRTSSLDIQISFTDVLFIDTIHTYSQLIKELWTHESRVRKYIILHDTEIPEMMACVTDFLYSPNWKIAEHLKIGTGLTVIERVV